MLEIDPIPDAGHTDEGTFERMLDPDPFQGFSAAPAISKHEWEDPLNYAFREHPQAPDYDEILFDVPRKVHLVDWFDALQYRDGGSCSTGAITAEWECVHSGATWTGTTADPLTDFVTAIQNGINAIWLNLNNPDVAVDDSTDTIPSVNDWIVSRSSDGVDVSVLVISVGNSDVGAFSNIQKTVADSGITYSQILDGTAADQKYVFAFMTGRESNSGGDSEACDIDTYAAIPTTHSGATLPTADSNTNLTTGSICDAKVSSVTISGSVSACLKKLEFLSKKALQNDCKDVRLQEDASGGQQADLFAFSHTFTKHPLTDSIRAVSDVYVSSSGEMGMTLVSLSFQCGLLVDASDILFQSILDGYDDGSGTVDITIDGTDYHFMGAEDH